MTLRGGWESVGDDFNAVADCLQVIAFFVETNDRARQIARHLGAVESHVDGPFHVIRGAWKGSATRVYTVKERADAAYCAGAIAIRRGAVRLIPITSGTLVDRAAEEFSIGLGQLLRVESVFDLQALGPLLRQLPDSAPVMPMPVTKAQAKEIWAGESRNAKALAMGTPPWAIANPHLFRLLFEKFGIAILDRQMAGYAAASLESEALFFPLTQVRSVLTETETVHTLPLELDHGLDQFLEEMLPLE